MSIVVTGATGHLGRLAVEALLARGVPADQIVATGRRIEALADLQERGVTVRRADYTDPESLRAAFAGAEKLLLVSGSEIGQRVPQHRNAITAAKEAGVRLIAYTSVARADSSSLTIAGEHKATEQLLAESGIPHQRSGNPDGIQQRGVWFTWADILAIGQMLPELMTPRQAKRAAAADAHPAAPDAPQPPTTDVLDRWASIGLR